MPSVDDVGWADITDEEEADLKKKSYVALKSIPATSHKQVLRYTSKEVVLYNGGEVMDGELWSRRGRGQVTIPPQVLSKVYQGYYEVVSEQ